MLTAWRNENKGGCPDKYLTAGDNNCYKSGMFKKVRAIENAGDKYK